MTSAQILLQGRVTAGRTFLQPETQRLRVFKFNPSKLGIVAQFKHINFPLYFMAVEPFKFLT